MPALESITIKGFKSIRDVEVKLRDINILIGANGSGKSNFLEVFSFLQSTLSGDLGFRGRGEAVHSYVARAGGAERLLHFGSKVTEHVDIHLEFQRPQADFSFEATITDIDTFSFGSGFGREKGTLGAIAEEERNFPLQGDDAGESDLSASDSTNYIRNHLLSSWRLYHFNDTSRSAPIRKTANLHDNRYLRTDGSNLAAFLYLLREKHEHSYTFLRNTVRLVAPFFEDFILEPLALNPDTIRLEWKHIGTDAYFDVSSLSDGTLRFIALATLLQQPVELRPSVILLDEPELGLHPLAITLLASMVKSASVDTQVILATQSPILLDHFEPEDVLVADRVNGATKFTRLNTEELAVWLKDYSIGELWEKNHFEGRPSRE